MHVDLSEILQAETPRVEWKESAESDDVFRAVCALANDLGNSGKPGYLALGVDKKGNVVGVGLAREQDEIQQRLANRLTSTKLAPTPAFDIRVEFHQTKPVAVITIDPYPVPPIITVNGVAWMRQGTTTRRATDADLARLRERRPEKLQPFDLRPFSGATMDDLDVERLRRNYEIARTEDGEKETFPDFERWLTQKQWGRPVSGVWTPNPACLVLHGLAPQSFFPGAKVEFVRYAGLDIDSAVAIRKTILGTLPDQLDALWAQLLTQLASVSAGGVGMKTIYSPQFPAEALKELARNMIQHRQYEGTHSPVRVEWYVDRIEFYNPGAPFGRASEGEFGSHTDYRNPLITAGLADLGYVEQLGRGIRRVRLLLEKNGNPPFEVETDGFTRVVVRARV